VEWNGGPDPADVTVTPLLDAEEVRHHATSKQLVSSHFGMGTVTIQNRWHYRTAAGINLMTVAPPNQFIDGISHMNGLIETDNLRRDFTFNLKITRPNTPIIIEKGTPVGCIIPYPRNFFDQFEMTLADDVAPMEHIKSERTAAHLAGRERTEVDAQYSGGIGRRYMEGKDIFGNAFVDHQKALHSPKEAARRSALHRGAAGLLHIKAVLSPEVCQSLCDTWETLQALTSNESERLPFFDGRVLHYQDVLEHQPMAAGYMKLTTDLAREHIKSHFNCGQIWADDIQLVKWWEGHTMEPHADKEHPDGSPHPTPWRDFASVVYLNNDYGGGAVEFPELNLTLHPQIGDIICFRGDLSHAHGVQMITSGQRFTMPSWYTTDVSRRSLSI
jgi:predicted 2-oxoglutarate/Fe(II)-dependent dioxygenase YbiX